LGSIETDVPIFDGREKVLEAQKGIRSSASRHDESTWPEPKAGNSRPLRSSRRGAEREIRSSASLRLRAIPSGHRNLVHFATILESRHRSVFNRSRSSFSFSRSGENENDYENENEPDLGTFGCGCREAEYPG
jgi:hypothetical protein